MINKKLFASFAAATLLLFPIPALANSSWAWLTDARPIYVLPFAIAVTLFIEVFIIVKMNGIKNIWIVITVVSLANILSFSAQFVLAAIIDPDDNLGYTFEDMIDRLPFYIVSAYYYFLTILVELPAVCIYLSHLVQNKSKLIVSVILANTITTALVAICERLVCVGDYMA